MTVEPGLGAGTAELVTGYGAAIAGDCRASLNYQRSIKVLRQANLVAAYPLRHSKLLRPSPMQRQHEDNADVEDLSRYLAIDSFTHRNTDGPLNLYARVYSAREVIRDFPSFELIRSNLRYMHVPPLPARLLPGQRWPGWHLWLHLRARPVWVGAISPAEAGRGERT